MCDWSRLEHKTISSRCLLGSLLSILHLNPYILTLTLYPSINGADEIILKMLRDFVRFHLIDIRHFPTPDTRAGISPTMRYSLLELVLMGKEVVGGNQLPLKLNTSIFWKDRNCYLKFHIFCDHPNGINGFTCLTLG
jgi:hypothetical protein